MDRIDIEHLTHDQPLRQRAGPLKASLATTFTLRIAQDHAPPLPRGAFGLCRDRDARDTVEDYLHGLTRARHFLDARPNICPSAVNCIDLKQSLSGQRKLTALK